MSGHVQMACTDNYCGGSCNACCLAWCSVCGGGEASLPTECPGERMSYERGEEVGSGALDWTADRGWHAPTAEERRERSPFFGSAP